MPTGANIVNQLTNVTTAPATGVGALTTISFGGSQVLQAVANLYLDITLADPTNTGSPANFEVQVFGSIQGADNLLASITQAGLTTVNAPSPITYWRADLISLSGGVAPKISVNGVAGE